MNLGGRREREAMKKQEPETDLRKRLEAEAIQWLAECPPSFQWTTEDVIDFAEVVFRRIKRNEGKRG